MAKAGARRSFNELNGRRNVFAITLAVINMNNNNEK
jgi:uncharacterized membrane protein (DUF485 family)